MISTLADPKVAELMRARDWPALGAHLAVYPPGFIADVLDDRDRAALFRALPRGDAYRSFAYLLPTQREALLRDLGPEETGQLIAALPPDDRTRVLGNLPAATADKLLETLGPEDVARSEERRVGKERRARWEEYE